MDKEATLQACYDHFGLQSDASMHEVERTFRELRKLYSKESLATYSLMDESERQEKLVLLQASFDLIKKSRLHVVPPVINKPEPVEEVVKEKPPVVEARIVFVNADPQQMPGLYLQQTRQARGLSLQDIAEQTKISAYKLQCIEEQRLDELPAPVYLRGFVKEFSRTVEVPSVDALVESFMKYYHANK